MFCKAWHKTELAVAHHTEPPIGFRLYGAAQTANFQTFKVFKNEHVCLEVQYSTLSISVMSA